MGSNTIAAGNLGFAREGHGYDAGVSVVAVRTEEAIESAFAAGGEEVLRDAYDRYGTLVFSYCRRMLDRDLAADATQEVFVAAWRSRARFDPARGSLAGWLIGIARFKAVDALRARTAAPHPSLTDSYSAEVADDTAHDDDLAERLLVTEALDMLSERARRAVELSFYEGLTHEEIAGRTGVPLGTVKSDIRRGLARLRRHLGGLDGAG